MCIVLLQELYVLIVFIIHYHNILVSHNPNLILLLSKLSMLKLTLKIVSVLLIEGTMFNTFTVFQLYYKLDSCDSMSVENGCKYIFIKLQAPCGIHGYHLCINTSTHL